MKIKGLATDELRLMLHALQSIHVADMEKLRAKMERDITDELTERSRGVKQVSHVQSPLAPVIT